MNILTEFPDLKKEQTTEGPLGSKRAGSQAGAL